MRRMFHPAYCGTLVHLEESSAVHKLFSVDQLVNFGTVLNKLLKVQVCDATGDAMKKKSPVHKRINNKVMYDLL